MHGQACDVLLRLTEIYLLAGDAVRGRLPDAVGNLSALVTLSIVDSFLAGPLPESLGHLPALGMLWLDNNKLLGGAVPPRSKTDP